VRLLTRDELTLADIALEVGCSCQSHLTTLFRKHLGTTPGAFRGAARKRQRRVPHFNSQMAGIDLTQVSMRGPRAAFAALDIRPQ
jgi:AraC-like DNA-binding protein